MLSTYPGFCSNPYLISELRNMYLPNRPHKQDLTQGQIFIVLIVCIYPTRLLWARCDTRLFLSGVNLI